MRYSLDERSLMAKIVRKGFPINFVAELLDAHRNTVSYWSKQDLRTKIDLPRFRDGKITVQVEIAILYMRLTFKWGTARIQQGLMKLPPYAITEMEVCVQNFYLSRTSINNVLKKHKLNGYRKKHKSWKFFRAEYANELWQVDLKEFRLEGKKYYIFVVIDDYSRYILLLSLFDHCPTTKELTSVLQKLKIKPEKVLADRGVQFKEQWKEWCKEQRIEAIFAHPYYPQDKGKVERTIRNLAEEFVNLLQKFTHWLSKKCLEQYRKWFNRDRYHRGIKEYPINLYAQL